MGWEGLLTLILFSFSSCRIPEPNLMVASRTIPGVKAKLHHFLYPKLALLHKGVVEEEEEEQRTGVRQEWVTGDRIIAARWGGLCIAALLYRQVGAAHSSQRSLL